MTELHGTRFATMLSADPDFEIWTYVPTGGYGKSNQLANTIPVEDLEWVVR